MRKVKLLIALLLSLALTGCAATSGVTTAGAPVNDSPMAKAGKSLLAAKSTIVTTATALDGLCKAKTIPADKCAQVKAAYELSKTAYDSAVDAYLLMSQGYGDQAALDAAVNRLLDIANNLLILSTPAGGAQ